MLDKDSDEPSTVGRSSEAWEGIATADEVGRQRGLGGWPWEPSRYCRTSGLLEAGGIR